jgi:transcriptional regulator with XRE-family HTH domain
VGFRGYLDKQQRARELRARSWTLQEIATELCVAKSTVSLWVRDVDFTPKPRQRSLRDYRTSKLALRKKAEIDQLRAEGRQRIAQLSEREFLIAGVALYAGEGAKRDGTLRFANSDPRMVFFFVTWLRHFFDVDESRLRLRQYLHAGLDIDAANAFWSELTGIPSTQFHTPYRAVPDASIRTTKHLMGCPSVTYSCSRTHRAIMGLVEALLSSGCLPG